MKYLLILIGLSSAMASFNSQAETITFAIDTYISVQNKYGYLNGQIDYGAIPADIVAANHMFGSFTINLDSTLQTLSSDAYTHVLSFVNATSGQFSVGSFGPLSFEVGETSASFTDDYWNQDHFWLGAQKTFIEGNFKYTYSFGLTLESADGRLGFLRPNPLTLPTPTELKSGFYTDQGGQYFSGSKTDISGTCTVNCTSSWSVTSGGGQPNLTITLSEIPIPGSIWLFVSAAIAPLLSLIRKRK